MAGSKSFEARGLACRRGGRLLFEGLSFSLEPGEALLLSGPNGTGKTSLLRGLAGLLPLEAGDLLFGGASAEQSEERLFHYIGHANGVKTSLSVAENLAFWADFYNEAPAPSDEIAAALAAFGLDAIAHLPAALLSAGQKRKLALCRLLVSWRPIWLLDEPTVSLDQASTKALAGRIKDHLARGGMALVATHTPLNLRFAHKLDFAVIAKTRRSRMPDGELGL